MNQNFEDKSAKIILVNPSGAIRIQHSDIIKSHGFVSITNVSDLQSAIEVLESEKIDWIITRPFANDAVNAFQLLKLIISEAVLRHVRVSLLMDESEEQLLPYAFSLGLFSWIKNKSSRSELEGEYKKLIETLEKSAWNPTKVSSRYIAEMMENTPKSRMVFHKSLIQHFPGDASILLDLAESYILNQKPEKAEAVFQQINLINENYSQEINQLRQKHQIPTIQLDADSQSEDLENTLNIESCLLIDNDASTLEMLRAFLAEVGVKNIHLVNSIEVLEEFSEQTPIDLIVFKWGIPQAVGPIIAQKLKHKKNLISSPTLTYNPHLEEGDKALLAELGVFSYIKMPINQKDFLKTVIWCLQQQLLPTEPNTLELSIYDNLANGLTLKAKGLFAYYKGYKEIPEYKIKQIEAELFFHDGKFQAAKKSCLESIKSGGESPIVLSLLGKIMIKLKDHASALRCLELADSMAPMNIARLCAISDCHLANDQLDEAKSIISEALELDANAPEALESNIKLKVIEGDTETAKNLLNDLSMVKQVVAFMNNKAVSLSVCQRVDESISLYKKTLESIPNDRSDILGLVHYNLALAHTRSHDYNNAIDQLKAAHKLNLEQLTPKIASLMKRIKLAIQNNEKVALKTSKQTSEEDEAEEVEDTEDYFKYLTLKKGEICCYKIYILDKVDPKIEAFTKKPLKFNPRASFDASETSENS